MYYFYVLYSLKDHKLYKGYSQDIGPRFIKHKLGGTTSTRNRRPLILIYVESFATKKEAMAKERWSKNPDGGFALKALLLKEGILDEHFKLRMSSEA